MSNIRDLGHKISSLQNMQKVTRAMNMISSIKLRKLFGFQASLELFSSRTSAIQSDIAGALAGLSHPVVSGYDELKKIHIIMFTADKGLCGTHNSSVQKAVEKFIQEQQSAGIEVEITSIGRKGTNFCRRKGWEPYKVSEIGERVFTKKELFSLAEDLFGRFIDGTVQKIYAVGNIFYSALQQETSIQQLLPFLPAADNAAADMQFEPDGESLAASAGLLFMKYRLHALLLNSLLSEYSARMTAMDNATNNSEDLINKYVTMQNHARQATITNELIEIVSGKEALKG